MSKYNTCSHARPNLRPFVPLGFKDNEPVFPVAPQCKKSVPYKVANPNSYIPAIRDRELCEACPLFTVPDKLITVRSGAFRADIYLDRLLDLPVTNIRKLIKLILSDTWANDEAIEQLTAYLEQSTQESKDAWKLASKEYMDGWRNVKNPKSRHPAVVEIVKNNNRLTRKVKAAKARYERWVKIKSIWADACGTKHPKN